MQATALLGVLASVLALAAAHAPCHMHVRATDAPGTWTAAAATGPNDDNEFQQGLRQTPLFTSIAAAQRGLRTDLTDRLLEEDLVVCLGPGLHSVAGDPLAFDAADSPR